MSSIHTFNIYPVDNADNSLVKLSDETTILIDCQIRNGEENTDGVKTFDVKKDLLKEVKRDSSNNPFVDLFILSHPHKDHCLGFEENFYTGKPSDYSDTNRQNEEILIGELWVTQMVFSNDICEQAIAIRKEAKRRKKLFEDNPTEANKAGNRLKIIGYNDNDATVEGLHYIPGDKVSTINGKSSNFAEIFIHAPFKSDLVRGKADKDHNATSIVFQLALKMSQSGSAVCKAIFGGDADHYIWEKVLRVSQKNNNTDKLEWDFFLAPHHCSWSFFNDRPYDENKTPKDYSLEFLDYKMNNAYVVSSSIEIKDNDQNPPHFHAKKEYEKKVGQAYFRNTAINISSKAPKPLVFTIDKDGLKLVKEDKSASSAILSSSTPRAGNNGN